MDDTIINFGLTFCALFERNEVGGVIGKMRKIRQPMRLINHYYRLNVAYCCFKWN